MPARKGRGGKRPGRRPNGPMTVTNYQPNHYKGIIATVIALILWMLTCIAIWFITKYQLEHDLAKLIGVVDLMGRDLVYEAGINFASYATISPESLGQAAREIINRLCLYRTLILGILELVLMIWPMVEYLCFFHHATSLRDHYKWYVPVVAMCIVCLIVVVIADFIVLALGWITLIQLLVLAAVIFIPRLFLQP